MAPSAFLAACSTATGLPSGTQAYAALAPPRVSAREYRIGSRDRLDILVLGEPDLTLRNVEVDSAGSILMPLIGSVAAKGMTAGELSAEIATRLDRAYLVDPKVTAVVLSPIAEKIIVEGFVSAPGVYEMRGRTTLLEALALAKGPTRIAKLGEVAVFRIVDGQRMGALFDVRAIRRGDADDPEILGSDMVVVGLSNIKAAWRDALVALPALAILRPLAE